MNKIPLRPTIIDFLCKKAHQPLNPAYPRRGIKAGLPPFSCGVKESIFARRRESFARPGGEYTLALIMGIFFSKWF
jgi:hypothetical protein